MEHRYSHILEPIRIGNVILKNRIFATKCISQELQGPENFPAEPTIQFVEDLAKNGAALVVCSIGTFPKNRNRTMFHSEFAMENMRALRYLVQEVERIHAHQSLAIASMAGGIPQDVWISERRHPEWIEKPLEGPFGDFGPDGKPNPPRPEISKKQIKEFIQQFTEECVAVKTIGFDGVNIYMSYGGSILAHSISPVINQREDEYGGSLENRARLCTELFREIKKACGQDFLIECQISGEEDMPGGYTVEDFLVYCKLWADEKLVDIFEIRAKNGALHHTSSFSSPEHNPTTLKYAQAFKKRGIKALAAPVGGFQNLDDIESFIREEKTDMVAMARAFICDPEFGRKLYSGRSDIVPCIRCDKCHGAVCSVNPLIGLSHVKDQIYARYPERSKKVAVIGGGPAGMKAAIVAAERGHYVTLYEKEEQLGGQLKHSDYMPGKWALKNYKDYLIMKVKENGITLKQGVCATSEMIKAETYDAVITACGATPRKAEIAGADDARVWAPIDCFGKEKELGKYVIVIGGASTGVDTAIYLADSGHKVTLISRKHELCYDNVAHGREYLVEYIHNHPNITTVLNAKTMKIENGTNVIVQQNMDGEKTVIKALLGDSIVFSAGVEPCVEECYQFAGITPEFYIIGDANIHNQDMWKRFMLPKKAQKVGGDVKHCTATAYAVAMTL